VKGPYTGKILRVDLTAKKISSENQDEALLRKYIGGRGLGAKLLYDLLPANTDPLSPENVIILTTGVLTGTVSLFSSRTNITTKSPLTNMICMGNCGGFFGPELKFAGFDGIVITGRSDKLSYIWIKDGEAEIRECEELKGRISTEAESRLLGMTDMKSRVLCTGPAADRGVKTACVYGDHRFIGRGGTGAVFGSKKLKGIVVRGTKTDTIPVVHSVEFSKIIDEEKKLFRGNDFFQLWRGYGTPFIVTPMNSLGLLGTNNFQSGVFDSHEKINGETLKNNYVVKKITCHRCPVACISLSEVTDGDYAGANCRGPEFETIYAFGSSC
jgi:aldehyde:ferredoxin oxidoreductase